MKLSAFFILFFLLEVLETRAGRNAVLSDEGTPCSSGVKLTERTLKNHVETARHNGPEAQYLLANEILKLNTSGRNVFQVKINQIAFDLFTQTADHIPEANIKLASMLVQGRGAGGLTDDNDRKAVGFLGKAHLKGHEEFDLNNEEPLYYFIAKYRLASMYIQNRGVCWSKYNDEITFRYLSSVVAKKFKNAPHLLALMYMSGRGVPKNHVAALTLFMLSKTSKSKVYISSYLKFQLSTSEELPSFEDAIKSCVDILHLLYARHQLCVEENSPGEHSNEKTILAPQFFKMYEDLVKKEKAIIDFLQALKEASPGLMITNVKPSDELEEAILLQEGNPFISYFEFEGKRYLSFGRRNVELAHGLQTSLKVFDEIENLLGQIRNIYVIAHKEITESSDNEKAAKKPKSIQDIDDELALILPLKDEAKDLIPKYVGSRNSKFLKQHPYVSSADDEDIWYDSDEYQFLNWEVK